MSVEPNFLFIGAARCASTWVHECLKEHPDVLVPLRPKELHFFNRDTNYERGLDWYRSFFSNHQGEKAIGEVTPGYLCDAKSPARIHQHFPDIRMIVSLRNPTERAYSSYKGYVLSGQVQDGESIVEASRRLVFDNQSGIIEHGFYYQHLQRYLQYFRREQMLILLYDDLTTDPQGFIQRIFEFLAVDPTFVPSVLEKRINESFRPQGVRASLIRKLNQVGLLFKPVLPKVQRGIAQLARTARNRIAERGDSQVPPAERVALAHLYREENEKLAKFLGRDLSAWQ